MKRHAVFTSSMHISIHYFIYEPQVVLRVKGIVQIHHGLGEHAGRYEHFASFLASHGYVVVVSDFAGHGRSLIDFEQGYFGEHDGPIPVSYTHLFSVFYEYVETTRNFLSSR